MKDGQDRNDLTVKMEGEMGLSCLTGYLFQAEIGKGSFGKVYRAFDEKEREQVAIKCIEYLPLNSGNQVCKRARALVLSSFLPMDRGMHGKDEWNMRSRTYESYSILMWFSLK